MEEDQVFMHMIATLSTYYILVLVDITISYFTESAEERKLSRYTNVNQETEMVVVEGDWKNSSTTYNNSTANLEVQLVGSSNFHKDSCCQDQVKKQSLLKNLQLYKKNS